MRSTPFDGAEIVNVPSIPVVVPLAVPSTRTVAPAMGEPSTSVTVPEICLFWAMESEIFPPPKQ